MATVIGVAYSYAAAVGVNPVFLAVIYGDDIAYLGKLI